VHLTHVRLLVGNYAECFRFYRDVLGLEAGFGDEESGYADFSAGTGSVLALFDRDEQSEAVELRETERFREHAVSQPESRAEWGIRFVHLRDPAGNLIELNQEIPMEGS
jgi:catechol 2,3-dioxygenase-like lactoylglutathione lyase family enzyme